MLLDKKLIKEKSSYMFMEFLHNNNKFKTIAHFRRTPGGWLIMLKIMENYFSDKNLCVEELIKEIPSVISSRLSSFSIIDSAVKSGILEKKSSSVDKRKKEVVPSQAFVNEYKEWLQTFSTSLDSKKKPLNHSKQLTVD